MASRPVRRQSSDGEVFGRGALDMKGIDAAMVPAPAAALSTKGASSSATSSSSPTATRRPGSYGSSWLAQQHWDKLDAGEVLTEGGWFLAQARQDDADARSR